jgi:hypothetical protein
MKKKKHWFLQFCDFLLTLKTDINLPRISNKQEKLGINIILGWKALNNPLIRVPGSVLKYHGSGTHTIRFFKSFNLVEVTTSLLILSLDSISVARNALHLFPEHVAEPERALIGATLHGTGCAQASPMHAAMQFLVVTHPPHHPTFPQISMVRDFSYGKGPTRWKLLQLSPRKQLGPCRFPKPSAKIMIYLAGIIAKIVCAVGPPPTHGSR